MSILIIIGIVMFIFALINWGQSQGYLDRISRLFEHDSSDETSTKGRISGVSGGNGGVIINNSAFALDEDYAYDDDSDYFDEF